MTKIIPTGVIGWKIIPVGSMYRAYHMKPGRCYWKYRSGWLRGKLRGHCLSVEVRPWSAWPVEPNARMQAWKLFEKNIPRAASCFWHTKGYAGDSGGIVVTYEDVCICMCVPRTSTHTPRTGFPAQFLQPYGAFVPVFCFLFLFFAYQRLPKIGGMKLIQCLHIYSFNIKGCFW